MRDKSSSWQATKLIEALPNPSSGAERYVEPFVSGDVSLGLYAPVGSDEQEPHDQDEFYFVISGSGYFVHGAERTPFRPGDALFVPAGEEHRFEDFDEGFAAWVVFWDAREDHA